MEKILHWLSLSGECVLKIFLYDKFFYISRIGGQIDDKWFDINTEALEPYTRVRSPEELVVFIRQQVADGPKSDQMIIFNMTNAICLALRGKGIKLR
jgi:hypothetical protein